MPSNKGLSSLRLDIDRSSPVPLYHQVAQGIEAAIRSGKLAPGSKLDNEIALAAELNLSRPTMRKAMDELVRSGLLVRKRGVGTQVVASQVKRHLELSSLFDDLQVSGKKPTSRILSFSHIAADEAVQDMLHLGSGARVYHLVRLRLMEGKPLALMENWVRDDVADLDERTLTERGLYEVLRAAGINFRLAQQRIGARTCNDYEADLLGVQPGSALVTMDRTAVDDIGRNIEVGHHVYRADSYSFEMTLVNR
ncbi:GntR family transcriptional regulator [Arthrobacter sp. B0490]|uniref:GntR family transcriptional regulator n=1 Tax=Arthrobacter sp. B0490 TaxID=2058891 RepID=UPI002157A901|nr:GntR family transcriptional regulator [Arthrobacter sp. B0490]